jgi:hypothetical protein
LPDRLIVSATEGDPDPGEIRNRVRALLADMIVVEALPSCTQNRASSAYSSDQQESAKRRLSQRLPVQAVARYNKKVALITTDLLRVGSQDQLSRFGTAERRGVYVFGCFDSDELPIGV